MTLKEIRRVAPTHLTALLALVFVTACASGPTPATGTVIDAGRDAIAGVGAANPMAVDAGPAVLGAGGSAASVDFRSAAG